MLNFWSPLKSLTADSSTTGTDFSTFLVRNLGTSQPRGCLDSFGHCRSCVADAEADRLIQVLRGDMVLSKLNRRFCRSPWMALVCLAMSCSNLILSRDVSGTAHV